VLGSAGISEPLDEGQTCSINSKASMQWGSLPLSTQIAVYAVVLVIAWLLGARLRSVHQRQVLLLGISYILYATWGLWFLVMLVTSSVMNYGLGIYLRRNPSSRRLWVSILLNVCF
jgi:hypothetical protein